MASRPSVCPSVCDDDVRLSHWLEYTSQITSRPAEKSSLSLDTNNMNLHQRESHEILARIVRIERGVENNVVFSVQQYKTRNISLKAAKYS